MMGQGIFDVDVLVDLIVCLDVLDGFGTADYVNDEVNDYDGPGYL